MAAATLSPATFLVSFREFNNANAAMVAAKVAEANRQIDADVWGTQANDAAGYLAAAMLAASDFGRHAEMDPARYLGILDRMKRAVAAGPVVI